MGYPCQIKRSCIQHKTHQQGPASNRQGHFQSFQWPVDFPQQSHQDFSSVQRQDRKQIKNGEIHIQGARSDLHSGDYGGAAPNAVEAAAQIIAALKDRDGHIRIPGLYDRVQKPNDAETNAWKGLPFDVDEYREKEIGSTALAGEPEYPVFERVFARPTLEVHGIRGGFTAEGAKTVIPARAVVKISLRLVPDQRPEEVVAQLENAVAGAAPRGVTAMFKLLSSAPACMVDPSHPLIQKAAQAMRKVFGRETVYVRCGGSIPIVGLFQQSLGIPSVLMGFSLPDDNIHAPVANLLHLCDLCRAANGKGFCLRSCTQYFRAGLEQHNPKRLVCLDAASDHQLITLFKDVQMQRRSRE